MDVHRHPLDLKVVNLWAGPGAGKSTTAAGLFNLMKTLGLRVELVTEFAKDMTYERNFGSLTNQLHVLAQQDWRLRRLVGEVDWAITDSPLPLGEAYMTPEYQDWLPAAIEGAYERYDNFDFRIVRKKPYAKFGRSQSEPAAIALDITIKDLFEDYTNGGADGIDQAWVIDGDSAAPLKIARLLGVLS